MNLHEIVKIQKHMLDAFNQIDKHNDNMADYRSGYLAAINELFNYLESEEKIK